MNVPEDSRRAANTRERIGLEKMQLEKLNALLGAVRDLNEFYKTKLAATTRNELDNLRDVAHLPFTTKQEFVEDQAEHPPFGTNLTFPLERYIRVHQTSGTTGRPLYWLDTEESWQWWGECWETIFRAVGVGPGDRVFFPFSFGPFIGFWSGWEGARKVGALAVSGGGQSTQQRLKTLMDYNATVLVCTPTYALHMAAEARKAGIDLATKSQVRITLHAGEPGASIPSTQKRIEEMWGARCFDHPGSTEVGAFGFRCAVPEGGVHINEHEFIAEVIDPETGAMLPQGGKGELVMTNLGRSCSPVIRYRTGDLVRTSSRACSCGRPFLILEGGVLGRVDDMVVVRGVNLFPSAVESVLREFSEIEEYRVDVVETGGLSEFRITIEPGDALETTEALRERVAERVKLELEIRPVVETVPAGTLPRFELKARRFFKT